MSGSYFDVGGDEQYQKVIEKAVEIKRKPITEKEKERDKEKLKISVIEGLTRDLGLLRQYARKLYGFNSVFREKVFQSASSQLSGSPGRNSSIGKDSLTVFSAAQQHRITSREIAENEEIPPGNFLIRSGGKEKSIEFPGGSVAAFERTLKKANEKDPLFDLSLIQKKKDCYVLVIHALAAGESGRLSLIEDTGGIMKKLELFTDERSPEKKNLFKSENLENKKNIITDERVITLEPGAAGVVKFSPVETLKNNGNLQLSAAWRTAEKTQKTASEEILITDFSMELGLTQRIGFEDLEFRSPMLDAFGKIHETDIAATNITPDLPAEPKQSACDPAFFKLAYRIENELKEYVYALPADFSNRAEGSVDALISFSDIAGSNSSESLEINSIMLFNRNDLFTLILDYPQLINETDSGDKWSPVHEITRPANAVFSYQGVRIEREENTISNLINDTVLTLHDTLSTGENEAGTPIEFSIERNFTAISDSIVNLIGQFNIVTEKLNRLQSAADPEPGTKEEEKDLFGLFRNETLFRMFRDKMHQSINTPYETSKPEVMRLLKQAGMSAVFTLGNVNDLNNGKIEVNEEMYKAAINTMPELTSELFGFSTGGDGIINSGFAWALGELVQNYTMRGAFFDTIKAACQRKIEQLEKSIADDEKKLESYKQKLARDGIEIKQAQEEFERMSKWLDKSVPK